MFKQNSLARIGIIGDVHAELTNLSNVLSYLSDLSLEAILCAGDIVDGPESVDKCCALLQKHQVSAVRGNHDNWFLSNQMRSLPEATLFAHSLPETQEYLQSLPSVREFQTKQGQLLLCHGIDKKDMGRVTPDDYGYSLEMNFELQEVVSARRYQFMVSGHTHRRMVRTFGGLTVINAGSLKQSHDPCFLTADFESGCVQFFSINASGGIEKMENVILAAVKSESIYSRHFSK